MHQLKSNLRRRIVASSKSTGLPHGAQGCKMKVQSLPKIASNEHQSMYKKEQVVQMGTLRSVL